MHQVKGKIKQVAGKMVGNRDLEVEGTGEHLDGKGQEKLAQVGKILGKLVKAVL